jgi:uncharacterized protein
MTAVFSVLLVQTLLGAFDNLWHHELGARLPQRSSARGELALHAMREIIYGLLFFGFAWIQWQGVWVLVPVVLLATEIVITCADFLEEDRSRKLPPLERVLHTWLAIGYGVLLGVLAPVLIGSTALPAAVRFVGYGWVSWFFSACGLLVIAWGVRNFIAVRQLRPAPAAQAMPTRRPVGPAVLVTGATGFIGSALTQELIREGRRVIVHSRDVLQARRTFGPAAWVVDRLDDIPSETRIDAVIHLAGAPVLGMPWTARRRELLVASRAGVMQQLLEMMRRLEERPRVLVAASAVGFYGVPGNTRAVDEQAPPQPGRFQSDLCAAIEREARRAEALGIRVVRLRFGIVLGRDGGAYPGLAFAARLGLGSRLGNGKQPVPWIHLDDAVGLVRFAMEQPTLSGAVNAVAPEATVQANFARAMAASFQRRVRLAVPDWVLRRLLGEMSELLYCGQWVVPAAAVTAGYRYRLPTLGAALGMLAQPVTECPGC